MARMARMGWRVSERAPCSLDGLPREVCVWKGADDPSGTGSQFVILTVKENKLVSLN